MPGYNIPTQAVITALCERAFELLGLQLPSAPNRPATWPAIRVPDGTIARLLALQLRCQDDVKLQEINALPTLYRSYRLIERTGSSRGKLPA